MLPLCLAQGSRTAAEWDANTDRVKAVTREATKDRPGGQLDFPDWWFREIIWSGLMRRVILRWGDPAADQIKIMIRGPEV